MISTRVLFSLLLLVAGSTSLWPSSSSQQSVLLVEAAESGDDSFSLSSWIKCWKCPKDDSYDPACQRSAIPPWPICLAHGMEYWVSKAKDGATRCCGTNIDDCRCPKKDTDDFQDKIASWCADIASCKNPKEGLEDHGDQGSASHLRVGEVVDDS